MISPTDKLIRRNDIVKPSSAENVTDTTIITLIVIGNDVMGLISGTIKTAATVEDRR